MRILIVEDHADTANLMVILFTRAGHDSGRWGREPRRCEFAKGTALTC